MIDHRGYGKSAGNPGRRFGRSGDGEIDLAAVGGIVTEVVDPGLIGDCPATFGSRIRTDPGDNTGICRSSSDTEIDNVEFLQGLERDRAAGANGQSGMHTRRTECQGNDRAGTHGNRAAHGQCLTGRSGAGFEDGAARGDGDRAEDGARAFQSAATVVYRDRAAGSK